MRPVCVFVDWPEEGTATLIQHAMSRAMIHTDVEISEGGATIDPLAAQSFDERVLCHTILLYMLLALSLESV